VKFRLTVYSKVYMWRRRTDSSQGRLEKSPANPPSFLSYRVVTKLDGSSNSVVDMLLLVPFLSPSFLFKFSDFATAHLIMKRIVGIESRSYINVYKSLLRLTFRAYFAYRRFFIKFIFPNPSR